LLIFISCFSEEDRWQVSSTVRSKARRTKWERRAISFQTTASGLAALTAGFRCPFRIVLEVAATAALAALLRLAALRLLLAALVVIGFVALLAALEVLFVTSTSIWHCLLLK
jgi:hypothetical protein